LVLPAYDYVLKCSHAFNVLDSRGAISTTERMGYIEIWLEDVQKYLWKIEKHWVTLF